MAKAILVIFASILASFLLAVFLHYQDCYGPKLRPPGEEWLHLHPRLYKEEFGEIPVVFRDYVYRAGLPGAEVCVATKTDPLFVGISMERFVERMRVELEEDLSARGMRACRGYIGDEAAWSCLEWLIPVDEGTLLQRGYLAARGNTKVMVLFSAGSPGLFAGFGDTTRWLRDLEWLGPGIAYAF